MSENDYQADELEFEVPEEFEEPESLANEGQRNFRCTEVSPKTYVNYGERSSSHAATVQVIEAGGDSEFTGFQEVEDAVEFANEMMAKVLEEAAEDDDEDDE